jgi:hypothetical protein
LGLLVEWEQLRKLLSEVLNRVEPVEVLVVRRTDWAKGREYRQADTQRLCQSLPASLEWWPHLWHCNLGNSQSEFVANLAIIDGDKPSLNLIFVM